MHCDKILGIIRLESLYKSMKAKPYFPYGINLNLKFSGAVVARGQHLKEGCAYCRGRELNHIKFQHWSWSFK